MRIIAGLYKGRRLKTLEGMAVRPTSDRLRETLFNVLGPRLEGARFADLCAGSGAVGIEALSRGAAEVTFVELSRRAAAVIEENLRHCRIEEGAKVIARDLESALRRLANAGAQFDLIFLDPPYQSGLYAPALRAIARGGLLAPDGILIAEHRRGEMLGGDYDGLRPYREIVQGDSSLTFFARSADPS
jgi:16S rRNA (guanine(966)-N(2))-methyltransferase RsmD